jgi:hypothetical protein
MTATPDSGAPAPRSLFQVTHYLRPAQANTGWSQSQSAELSYADAQDWILHQHLDAMDLGFADGPAVAAADPSQPATTPTPASEQLPASPSGSDATALGDA